MDPPMNENTQEDKDIDTPVEISTVEAVSPIDDTARANVENDEKNETSKEPRDEVETTIEEDPIDNSQSSKPLLSLPEDNIVMENVPVPVIIDDEKESSDSPSDQAVAEETDKDNDEIVADDSNIPEAVEQESIQPSSAPSGSEAATVGSDETVVSDEQPGGGSGGDAVTESSLSQPDETINANKVSVLSVEEVIDQNDTSDQPNIEVAPVNADEHYPEMVSGAEILQPSAIRKSDLTEGRTSPGVSLRDSVTLEIHNLSEMKLEQFDPGSSASPPLEKREEVWSKFPMLESFPASDEGKSSVKPKVEEPVMPPLPKPDSGLSLLRELVEGSSAHTDDMLGCILRLVDGDVHKSAEVISNLMNLVNCDMTTTSKDANDNKVLNESEEKWMHLTAEEEQDHDKKISIDSNEIGITVENVLERTVVHLVKEGSAAEQLGVTAGVLLLAVHNSPTFQLSHFETVDALKRAPRPAKLRFRPLPPPLLVEMRNQMQSLVVQTSAHVSIQKHVHKFPSTMKAPSLGEDHPMFSFVPPPLPPKVEKAGETESGHRPAAAAPLVTEWACQQLKLLCQVYAMTLSNATSEKCKKQQLLVIDILSNFHESCRRPTRSKSSASHTHKLGSLTQLINSLVFGLPDISPRPSGGASQNCHRQIDWCSVEMKPLVFTLIDIACALLESDCDVPLMYQMAPPSSPNVFFDASLEPVLNDGAAGALLVVAFRALFHHEPSHAVQVSSSVSASLASTKCERGRVSACRLVLEVYYHTDKFVSEGLLLRGIATRLLVQSQEPSVRAAAVTSIQRLGKFATLNDLDWLNLLCETAASDDDTMVRRGGFEFSLRLLHRLPDLFPSHVLSFNGMKDADIDLHLLRCRIVAIVQRLVEDPVPSVRHAVAAHCASLCTLLGGGRMGQQWSTWIVDTLHTFLRDDDAPVRSAAIDAIPFVTLLLRGFAHYYVYHANMHPLDAEAKEKEGVVTEAVVNRVISWNDVARLIRECIAKSGATEVVVQMSVTSMKRTASMLLPALLKLSKEAPEDVRCKVAGAVGQFFVHIQDEVLLLDLGSCGVDGSDREEFKKHAWKTLSKDLVCNLVAPLIKAIMKDQCLQVVATLFTELAGLPQSFSWLDAEGGGRGSQPMSSIYLLTEELLSDSRSVLELHDAGANKARHWAIAEIVPEELLKSFVVELEEMTGHRDWRNRAVAVRGVLSFASFATTSAMQSRLAQICIRMMNDKVHAVRLAAAESICLTGLIHSDAKQTDTEIPAIETSTPPAVPLGDWSESVVIPQLYDLMQRAIARERQLALYMIQILVSLNIVTRDVTIGVLIPLLLNAAQDVVSNVRLSVAKTLYYFMRGNSVKSFGSQGSSFILNSDSNTPDDLVGVLAKHSELHKCIERLCADEDLDVNYHARQAKSALDTFLHPAP